MWRNLKRQLPRFGLNRKLRGRQISAAVVRCLIYGVQCREVCGATVRTWQAWLNSVAREATKTRLQDMHDSKLTQQDVNKSLGIWSIKIYIGQAQLQYLGHVARLSPDRPERIALFGWLPHELPLNTGKSGTKSRRQLWQRLLELMFLHHSTPPSQVAATCSAGWWCLLEITDETMVQTAAGSGPSGHVGRTSQRPLQTTSNRSS